MDRIIEVKVFGNHLTKDSKNAGTRGEANVTHLRISFDKGWDGYTKKITFWDARGLNPVAISLLPHLSENQNTYLVSIPPEPMKEAGMLTFVIEGTVADKIQRSLSAKLEVEDAPDTTGAGQSAPPTEDELTQLEGEIEKIKDDVLEVMDAREETRMLAEKAKENANKAEDAVGKTSYIGENGNWYSWDSASGAFYDTGIKASAGLSDEDMEKIKILVNSKEDQGNKKDVIDDSSDDAAYPSTKAVKNYVVTLLTNYYKKSETYGKDEVDKLLVDICSLVSESLSNYYTKEETDSKISSVYKYCGSVDNLDVLLNISNKNIGDTYNVINGGKKSTLLHPDWEYSITEVDSKCYLKISDNGKDITNIFPKGFTLFPYFINGFYNLTEYGWEVEGNPFKMYPDAANNISYQINIECDNGDNVAWTGYCWDVLSGIVDLSNYYTKTQIDSKIANEFYEYEGSVNVRFNDVNARIDGIGNVDISGKQDKDKMITFNPFGILPEDITDWYPSVPSMMYYVESYVGNIEEATAAIIALQNSYIGGETV